ncbi:hypothetical protein Tco_0292179 [Tanacetum coccineum]
METAQGDNLLALKNLQRNKGFVNLECLITKPNNYTLILSQDVPSILGVLLTGHSLYDLEHLGVKFRLGGELRTMSLMEFGWRVGLYFKDQSREISTRSGLHRAVIMKVDRLFMEFWPTISWEDDEVEEEAEEGAGGSFSVYRNMSKGDWKVRQGQWMD